MHKLSIAHLKERFHSPLRHLENIQVAPILEAETVKPAKPETNFQIQPKPSPAKDDFSSYYLQTQLAKFTHQNSSSSVLIKPNFCCEKNNSKVVATNHTSQLYSCHRDKCQIYSKYLFKLPMEN